eukprot:gene7844-9658_t
MEEEEKKLDENKISKILSRVPEQYHKTSFEARKAALDYMRSSNRKELLDQIENWLDEINEVTDEIVEGFNKSIHNYSRILQFMGESHSNAISMSKEVLDVNKLITFNNLSIERLWRRNLEYYYQIQILEKMEELKKVPGLLDSYLSKNHFVHASNLLVNSLNVLNEKDLINVNALMDLRQSLNERKEQLKDIIIEKLNDHIYLKTNQSLKGMSIDDDDENQDDFESNLKRAILNNSTSATNESISKQNNQHPHEYLKLEEPSKSSNSLEDLNINPENHGKLFMNLLVEALDVLNYLQPAVGLILGRISIELKQIITSSTSAISYLYQSEGRVIPKIPGEKSSSGSSSSGSSSASGSSSSGSSSILNRNSGGIHYHHGGLNGSGSMNSGGGSGDEHFSFHFLSETFNRNELLTNNTLNIPLVDLLKTLFSKIREMLRIHLHDTSSLLMSTNQSANTNENSKTIRLFSFNNSIVTDYWNGATSSSPTATTPSLSNSGGITNGTGGSGNIVVGIFKASQYNVTPIYPLIVKFTDQTDKLLSSHSLNPSNEKKKKTHIRNNSFGEDADKPKGLLRLYIDDFVHRNFLQHIKNDYKERITSSIEGTEAFKPLERFKLVFRLRETKPILNSTLHIFQFITELFSDIVAMSHYVIEFGAIIQTCLLRYYEKCQSKFNQELEPTVTGTLMNTDLYKYILSSLDQKRQDTLSKFQDSREEEYEFKLESDLFQNPEKPILKNQLMLDFEKLSMLANMNYSLEWLADKVCQLLLVSDSNTVDSTPIKSKSLKNPKNIYSSKSNLSNESIEALKTMEHSIKDITHRFRELSKKCLISLRIEYRIHCFYHLEGFKKASYVCDEERTDPDSFIVDLNKDLSTNEEQMSIYLSSDKCQFLFGGIAKLIGKLLITKLSSIKQINNNGVAKLCKNVFTLQQNLSNIIVKREIFFDRIRQFYQSLLSEDELINYLVEKLNQPYFSLEEGRIILDFLITTKRVSGNAIQTLEAKYKSM